MENNKICPLLSITSEDNLTDCYGESCAGTCARGGETVSYYRTCPICGAYLDPCERCDCQDEKEAAASATNTDSGRVETGLQALLSVSSLHENKEDCKDEEA